MKLKKVLAAAVISVACSGAMASTVYVNNNMGPVEVGTTNLVAGLNPNFFELVVGSSGSGFVGANFTLVDSSPEIQTIDFFLYKDTIGDVGTWSLGDLVDSWSFLDILGDGTSTHFSLLTAGTQYVLKMAASGTGSGSGSTSEISAVPLPAAAWLFGSALLGLGAMRRKQKAGANAEMAVA